MERKITWKIYYEELDENGQVVGRGVHPTEYFTKGWAQNIAKKHYGNVKKFRYIVSYNDPWEEYIGEETCVICGEKYESPENFEGYTLAGYQIMLSVWDNTGCKNERWIRTRLICPMCGEQLRKCMEGKTK